MPVTIPGRGDLSPRRRHHRPGRWLAAVVVIALIAAGGYAGYHHFHHRSSGPHQAAPPLPRCPAPQGNALFAAPSQVKLRIVNGSLQTGLAAHVRSVLHRRGFHVRSIGNALTVGHNVAAIKYSPDQLREARALSAQVAGAVVMKPVAGSAVLELDLGLRFTTLATARSAHATEQRALAASSPSPSATPSPTGSPTCQPS